MKIEDNVCTLAQAIKLKELGVKQDSLFYHFPNPNADEIIKEHKLSPYYIELGDNCMNQDSLVRKFVLDGFYNKTYSAFTVGELGELMQEYVLTQYNTHGGYWEWKLLKYDSDLPMGFEVKAENDEFNTEAEARADMLIYLLENKIIKLGE